MSRRYSRLVLAVATSIVSCQLLAAAPFSEFDLTRLRQYMYANLPTKEGTFTKIDGPYVIYSLPGAVLASPSNKGQGFSQDYQFHWMRDAGITMHEVTQEYVGASAKRQSNASALKERLLNYISFEKITQQQQSAAGEQTLGQPKFNINATVWEGPWGRPQNDGPAIRALAITEIQRTDTHFLPDIIPMVKTDLNYVVQEWQQPNFDLWEEVKDKNHFFTKMMQQRALTAGANLLYFADQPSSKLYTKTANDIRQSLTSHWNEKLGYITETVDQLNYKGGGLNSAVVLAVLYANDLHGPFAQLDWTVLDDKVMSTVAALRDAFAKEYPVNQSHPQDPPLIGRYPGDMYDGNHFQQGNPWVLTTAGMAEYYYSLAYVYYHKRMTIEITPRNQRFYEQIRIKTKVGDKYKFGTDKFNGIIATFIHEGDRYLETIKHYQLCESDSSCLHFSEQIDAKTGNPTSAKDLTWSYVSILRAMRVREWV